MRESGFLTWKAALAAWVRASRLSKRTWSWRWTPATSAKCLPVSSVMDGNVLVSVLHDVYEPCALCFRETEANNGVHVWEASHQRRHDHGHQTGETYGSHEQGQTVKLCSPVLALPDCNLISCLNDPTRMITLHLPFIAVTAADSCVDVVCLCVPPHSWEVKITPEGQITQMI